MSGAKCMWDSGAECVGADAIHRSVFVPVDLLYGEFCVCLISPVVGTKEAESSTLEDRDLMMPVVGAVLWLGNVFTSRTLRCIILLLLCSVT